MQAIYKLSISSRVGGCWSETLREENDRPFYLIKMFEVRVWLLIIQMSILAYNFFFFNIKLLLRMMILKPESNKLVIRIFLPKLVLKFEMTNRALLWFNPRLTGPTLTILLRFPFFFFFFFKYSCGFYPRPYNSFHSFNHLSESLSIQ